VKQSIRIWLREYWVIITLMVAKLIVHFSTNTIYELQRDAFLYSDLGEHLAWGFHSVPPSIGVFANISRFIFGDTTFALRFFPAITGTCSILLIGLMVKEMGGNKLAQFIACLAFLTAPSFLRSNTLFQPVTFNQFYWLLISFLIFRLITTDKRQYWLWIGVVSGFAFLNKYSVVFFLVAFAISIFISPLRKWMRKPSPYVAAGIALLIALPNIIWQIRHDWPVILHMRELAQYHLVHVRTDLFLLEQIMMNLPAVFIWIPGLLFLLIHKTVKDYRIFGFIYILVTIQLLILSGKHYYTLGLYTTLFAFGGYAIIIWFRNKLKFIRYLVIGMNIIIAVVLIPISLPVLKPAKFIEYTKKTGMEKSQRWEDGQYHDLPQDYADMVGWNELTEVVYSAFMELTPDEQQRCSLFANNYGEAGSVNFLGDKYGLPEVISYHDSYLFWAPDSISADFLIKIGEDDNLPNLYHDVQVYGSITNPYARQSGTPIYLCRNPKLDINSLYQEELKERKKRY
jgi:hypothetical protein